MLYYIGITVGRKSLGCNRVGVWMDFLLNSNWINNQAVFNPRSSHSMSTSGFISFPFQCRTEENLQTPSHAVIKEHFHCTNKVFPGSPFFCLFYDFKLWKSILLVIIWTCHHSLSHRVGRTIQISNIESLSESVKDYGLEYYISHTFGNMDKGARDRL